MKETHVVTSFIMHEGKILILKRSGKVGSFRGAWAGVSGFLEENETPLECALKEIEEETGLRKEEVRLISESHAAATEKDGIKWIVHPFLFETSKKEICLDWEHDCCEWIDAKDVGKYETVPKLKETLEALMNAHG